MTAAVVIAFLAVLALAYVAVPLRRPQPIVPGTDTISELEDRKHAALVAILDLEAEHDVGKLSYDDLQQLRGTYESEALATLAALDDVNDAPDALEQEIAAVRRRLQQPPG